MKGGVAAMVFGAEALRELGLRLGGDLIVNTVSEEETTGAGGLVTARTVRADAAIVAEPCGLAVLTCCRGSLRDDRREGPRWPHAGIAPRHHRQGGAVSAVDKAAYLLEAIRRLNDEWMLRPRHPHLSPASAVVTGFHGGEWIVSVPARCRIEVHFEFLPEQADAAGWGSCVEREVEDGSRRPRRLILGWASVHRRSRGSRVVCRPRRWLTTSVSSGRCSARRARWERERASPGWITGATRRP